MDEPKPKGTPPGKPRNKPSAAGRSRYAGPQEDARRERIRAARIVQRLESFILQEPDVANPKGAPVVMTAAQVTAALGLLRKVLPDLAVTEVKGETNVRFVIEAPKKITDVNEWAQTYRQPALIEQAPLHSGSGDLSRDRSRLS